METTQTSFDHSNPEDKHFFAGIFNSILLNIELSLKELSRRNQYAGGDHLEAAFKNASYSDWERNFSFLSESFHFMEALQIQKDNEKDSPLASKKKSKEDIFNLLKAIINQAKQYRNYYSHKHHSDVELTTLVSDFLNELLLESAYKVKKNAKSDSYKEHLYTKYKSSIDIDVNERNKDKPRNKQIKADQSISFTINRAINYYIDSETNSLKEFASCSTSSNELSRNGLILFSSLFLNKKQLEYLFSHTEYFKDTRELKFQITRWVFSSFAYRDIRKLFKSSFSKDSLLLQMVDELTKCPHELFTYLSSERRKEFIEDLNSYISEGSFDKEITHEVIRKRYENKFPYFAIRFLDEFMKFPSLRFAVTVGKFNHDSREKEYDATHTSSTRNILEKMTVYERLSFVTEKKESLVSEVDGEENNKDLYLGWQKYPMPHYNIVSNNIPIWMDVNIKCNHEVDPRKKDKPSKQDILAEIEMENSPTQPIAFLSVNELPALLHSILVEGKTAKEIETIIKSKIYKLRNELRNPESLSAEEQKNLPKRLYQALNSSTGSTNSDKLKADIEKELDKAPLSDIRDKYSKTSKNADQLSTSEKGKIAVFISNDMVRFAHPEDREKIKGHQHSEFQKLLSYYNLQKDEVKTFINNDLGIDLKNHSIKNIHSCFYKNNLIDFYDCYMNKRDAYLEDLLKKAKSGQISWGHFNGFTKRKYINASLEEVKKGLLDSTVNLGRGIFDPTPTCHSKNNKSAPKAKWFKYSNDSDKQLFYSYNRNYPIQEKKDVQPPKKINTIGINPNTESLTNQYNNFVKSERGTKFRNQIYKNELQIKRVSREDVFTLIMVNYLFKNVVSKVGNDFELNLNEFFIEKKLKEEIERKALDGEPDESYILNKQLEMTLLDGKIKDVIRLKNVGKFNKLQNDQRIHNLCSYDEDKVWKMDELHLELESYEFNRSNVIFKLTFDLEKIIYERAKESNALNLLEKDKNPQFRKYLSYYFISDAALKEKYDAIEIRESTLETIDNELLKKLYLLLVIRNKFAHNQLISKMEFTYLNSLYSKGKDETYSSFICRSFETITKEILSDTK